MASLHQEFAQLQIALDEFKEACLAESQKAAFYVRLLVGLGVLLLLMATCHPVMVSAGAHAHVDNNGPYVSGGPTPLSKPKVVTNGIYSVAPVRTDTNPHNIPLTVHVTPSDTHYVDVRFHNELASVYNTHETVIFHMEDGLQITVTFEMGDGATPDRFIVTPPPGFRAVPESMLVDEGGDGVIEVHEALLG